MSSALTPFTKEQLRDLLVVCESNNRKNDISGMLLYKDGNFMQVLEGPETAVLETHSRIASDPRHHGLITLLQGSQQEREFPGWSMGFRDLQTSSPQPAGYSEFLNSSLTFGEFATNPSRAHKLLLTFKNTR